MKKNILSIAIAGLSAISMTGFGKVPEKNVSDYKPALCQTKKDTSSGYQKFKKEAEIKIKQFDKDIAQLKAKAKNENKELQDKYNKEVIALEHKNKELKKQLEKEKKIDKAKFDAFKADFDKSMDDLGKSIQDLMSGKK